MFKAYGATVSLLSVACLVPGCSVFTPPKAKPVIEDRVSDWGVKKIGVLATTAERRVVLDEAGRITTVSHGKEKPVATALDQESQRRNRRGETIFKGLAGQ